MYLNNIMTHSAKKYIESPFPRKRIKDYGRAIRRSAKIGVGVEFCLILKKIVVVK